MRYSAVWPIYSQYWDKMVITPSLRGTFTQLAKFAVVHKAQYQEVQKATSVPWYMVAVIHRREGDGNFDTYLGNGQSLHVVTSITPKRRGPFPNFLAGAIDALRLDQLASVIDWRLEKILYWLTTYNGWGYGAESPYIWAGTNLERRGKYTSDDHFDPDAWDTQPGCAPLLASIAALDPSVKFVRETAPGQTPVPPTIAPGPVPRTPPLSTTTSGIPNDEASPPPIDWAGQIGAILEQMKHQTVPAPTPKNPVTIPPPVKKTPGPTVADTKLCINIATNSLEGYLLNYVQTNYPFAAGIATGAVQQLAGGAATAVVDALIARGKII